MNYHLFSSLHRGSNPGIEKFMREKNLGSLEDLEGYYAKRILQLVQGLPSKYIIWQDPIDNNIEVRTQRTPRWSSHCTGMIHVSRPSA